MYTAYANEISDEYPYYDQAERTPNIQLPPIVGALLLTIWAIFCLAGLGTVFLAKQPIIGAAIIGIPTFIGMVLRPGFALCVMMLVLPTGAGIAYGEMFSLDRGVGIVLAVSFAINAIVARPGLQMRNKALWALMLYTLWIILASLAGPYLSFELRRAFTQLQLFILFLITYWILETSNPKTLTWVLRSYVLGTLATIALALATGAAIRAVQETGEARYAATLGRAIDANMLGALTAMAFLAAIYLLARDKSKIWRILYLAAILFLPMMMLRIGSRGAIVALALTMLSPLIFIRQVVRRPALAVLLVTVVIIASLSASFLARDGLEQSVARRLTDVGYAKESISVRMQPIKKAVEAAVTRPTGTSYYGWFERAQIHMLPHSDFFLVLGCYGIPGAVLFALIIILMILTIRRMPLGLEKLYARSLLIFLIVMGLTIGQVFKKYYWVFLAVALAAERLSWFYVQDTDEEVYEEAADTDYLPHVS